MRLQDIQFPVYKVPSGTVESVGTKVLLTHMYRETKILDDTALSGPLGSRRLQLAQLGEDEGNTYKLAKLDEQYTNWESMLFSTKRRYIASSGQVFFYKPSKSILIKYYEVKTQVVSSTGVLLYLQGFPTPVKVGAVLNDEVPKWYVGIGLLEGLPLVYDVSETRKCNTWRKI